MGKQPHSNFETKTYPKSRRIRGGYGTPIWLVHGESDTGFPLGMVCRGPDGRTWEARGTDHIAGIATKTAAEDEVRRQWRVDDEARANVIDLAAHRRSRGGRP